jgi:hypothetical protein
MDGISKSNFRRIESCYISYKTLNTKFSYTLISLEKESKTKIKNIIKFIDLPLLKDLSEDKKK